MRRSRRNLKVRELLLRCIFGNFKRRGKIKLKKIIRGRCVKNGKSKFIRVVVLIAVDALSIWLGFYFVFLIRFGGSTQQSFSLYFKSLPVIIATLIIILSLRHTYTKSYLYFLDEMLDLFTAFLIVSLVFMSLTFVYKIGPAFSRIIVGFGFFAGFLLDILFHFLVRFYFAKFKISTRNVLIIGAGKTGEITLKSLNKSFLFPYNIIGILDDNKVGDSVNGVKTIGKIPDLEKVLKNKTVDEVVFAITNFPIERLLKIEKVCDTHNVVFKMVPNVFGLSIANAKAQDIGGVLLLELTRNKIVGLNVFIKRLMDIIVSLLALIVLSPLFFVIAVLIKMDSKGPIFFKHRRIGKDAKPFYCIKFRTMVVNAEEVLKKLFEERPSLREEFEKNFKLKDDPRVTKIGRILRKTSLDEMPQIINVLRGEMSIIGPRPIVEKEVEKYGKYKDLLLQVKPGMAGFWVANGRSDVDYEERVIMDAYYIKNWSLWLDVKIFIYAAISALRRRGAY